MNNAIITIPADDCVVISPPDNNANTDDECMIVPPPQTYLNPDTHIKVSENKPDYE